MLVDGQPTDEEFSREPQGNHPNHPPSHHQNQPIRHRHSGSHAVEGEGQIGEGKRQDNRAQP